MAEPINELAAALAQAQGIFTNPPRNREVTVVTKTAGTYKFKYSTLDAIMDMIRKPLADNGLAISHSLGNDDQGPICETRLIHASGQSIYTWVPILVSTDANAQSWGAAITYARRYGLCSLLAIAADEDDDANSAVGNQATFRDRTPATWQPKPKAAATATTYAEKMIDELEEQYDYTPAVASKEIATSTRSKTLMEAVVRIEKNIPDAKQRMALLALAAAKMRGFAVEAANGVTNIEDCDKYAPWFYGCRLFDAALQAEIKDMFRLRREQFEHPSDAEGGIP